MNNDDPEPPNAVLAHPVNEPFHENGTDIHHAHLQRVPETPPPPPATTLNSCRPPEPISLPEKHAPLIHTLQGQNAKLYEDNCKLVNAVNTLNDRLAFLGAPQNIQAIRFIDMQENLRTTEASRALISRKYQELLQSTSPGAVQHHIMDELNAIREAYTSLDRDYRLLGERYVRLKSCFDASRVLQQQSQGTARGHISTVRPEQGNATHFRQHDQSRNNYASPTSVISPGPLQSFLGQKGNNRRRGSETATMAQPSGPTPVATTWLPPLPTPPPSAPMPTGQMSPTGFPVHAPVSAGSLLLPHHPQITRELPGLCGPPAHPVQGAAGQPNAAMHLRGEVTDATLFPTQNLVPPTLTSSPRRLKRPIAQYQPLTSPVGEHKKARIEEVAENPAITHADSHPTNNTPSSPSSTDPYTDRKSSVADANLDIRSDQECVDLIFEKDANIENGVFCGLCLDRHEAKMIPEPPDVLIQPDFNLLVTHCMTMHPAVWDDLRRKA